MIVNIIRNYRMEANARHSLGKVETYSRSPEEIEKEIKRAWGNFNSRNAIQDALFIKYFCEQYPEYTKLEEEDEIDVVL